MRSEYKGQNQIQLSDTSSEKGPIKYNGAKTVFFKKCTDLFYFI